jgi:AraC-like DNA-binding protein
MRSQGGGAVFEHFATRDQPLGQRLDYWNELISGIFDGMSVSADRDIDATWSQCSFGDVKLAVAHSQKSTVDRWAHGAQPSTPSNRILVHLQHVGSSVNSQGGLSSFLRDGDLAICSADEPYQLAISERNTMLVLDCPAPALAERTPDLESSFGRHIDGQTTAARLLRDFILSTMRQPWPQAPAPEDCEAIRDVLLALVTRTLTSPLARVEPESEAAESTRQRVIAFVHDHLFDSDLRTGFIAQTLGLSPRTVQGVFASMATTPTAFILNRRLEKAAEVLASGADFGTITELAFALGFNDSAYFTRLFRNYCGLTPTTFRRARAG